MHWGKIHKSQSAFTPAEYLFKFIGRKIRKDLGNKSKDDFDPMIYEPCVTPACYKPDHIDAPEGNDKGKSRMDWSA
jgi:hypothetical protein